MKLAAFAIVILHATAAHAGPTCEATKLDLEKRCAANKLDACLALGVNHQIAADTCYPKKDPAPMVSALQKSCDAGDGARCVELADAYWGGDVRGRSKDTLGLRVDHARALALWDRACKLDEALACETLLYASAPREAPSVVSARSDAANTRLAQVELRACTRGAPGSHYMCFAIAERLRTGNGIAADRKLADVMDARGKVLQKAAEDEWRRIHKGNW